MLVQADAIPTIGVKNLKEAKEFYETKLGLTPLGNSTEYVQLYKSGNSTIEIYQSDFAGTNRATAMTWAVGDEIEKDVEALRNRGVEFERYEMPDTKLEGDIHVMKDMKTAWFKDPDGNILCLHDH
jgi:catechol 2,3-dioxygenase-like lactoylglutathione lyase family enzyme